MDGVAWYNMTCYAHYKHDLMYSIRYVIFKLTSMFILSENKLFLSFPLFKLKWLDAYSYYLSRCCVFVLKCGFVIEL